MVSEPCSYQLLIHLAAKRTIAVGRLGRCRFPAGYYVYTGSARRNLRARLQRHLAKHKRLRWHIDYLLADPAATVVDVQVTDRPECDWNHATDGAIVVDGFGASDCRAGCGSHLKHIGKSRR